VGGAGIAHADDRHQLSLKMPATAALAASLAPPANAKVPLSTKSTVPYSTKGPSNISLFLTSLRLLDLDKHPEWPGISRHTFSPKDAQQSQKNRIRCVEWALYRLFEIWDGEWTRNVWSFSLVGHECDAKGPRC
jgi:hypothetical protein